MAGFFQVTQFEARKRALVAESEAYRQTLQMEVQHLLLAANHSRKRFWRFTSSPLLMLLPLAAPFLRSFFRQRVATKDKERPAWLRVPMAILAGWQTYRRIAPALGRLLPQRRSKVW
jgi:hypothetical protein